MKTPFRISYVLKDIGYERYFRSERAMINAYYYLKSIPEIRFLRREVLDDY
ncbi:MAG: hypothetical protein PHU05_02320 [Bacilli bacterium]|nr:hypothetical protein [Bacilli bacterium]